MYIFKDRAHAGQKLAEKLTQYANRQDIIILALPRGGVPVAYEVAKILGVPLDVFIVRKLGMPSHKEFAMGAIALGGTILLSDDIIERFNIGQQAVKKVIDEEMVELNRRNHLYRNNREFPHLTGKTVILIDDGLATGATASAAITSLKKLHPDKIVLAAPVGSLSTCNQLTQQADQVICLSTPEPFYAVGQAYEDFSQTSDGEVLQLLSHY
jgi:predicted phosphoribosyltransferase